MILHRDSAGRRDAGIPDVPYALAAFIPMTSRTASTRAGNPRGSRLWPFFFVKFEANVTPRRKSTHFCLLPPATKLGQGYVFTRVCDSVHGGGPALVHAGIPPLGVDTPRKKPGRPPPVCMLGDIRNMRAVRILLECILVSEIVL